LAAWRFSFLRWLFLITDKQGAAGDLLFGARTDWRLRLGLVLVSQSAAPLQ
jgi:hypothetical protein